MTRLVCIADTHNRHARLTLPPGDVLVHAGDCTSTGTEEEVVDFLRWMQAQPHPAKVMIAGNHDHWFEESPDRVDWLLQRHAPSVTYLEDSGATVAGLKFWGSPVQPWFWDWAFNRRRGPEIQWHWDQIPSDTQVLVTHGPPHGYLDKVLSGDRLGCRNLTQTLPRLTHLWLCVFGHLHLQGGCSMRENGRVYVNAAVCDDDYQPVHSPLVVDL